MRCTGMCDRETDREILWIAGNRLGFGEEGMYKKCWKRCLDFLLSLCGILVLSPVLLVLGVLVRVKLGSPVLFRQERPGKQEKIFTLCKFRTMTDEKDAEGKLLPDAVRLTRFGKFLRATSLDELPELFNILKGDMSIIGPRPLLPEEVQEKYTEPEQRLLLSLRPGLTGLWQVKGRSQCTYESGERQKAELYYVQNYSPRLDFTILLHTVRAIVKGDGAM